MTILPASKREWLSMLLFPFKAYVIIIAVWGIIQTNEPFRVREAQMRTTNYILAAYAGCVLVFILAAAAQFITHHRRPAIGNALFAVAAFVALVFLLPIFALAK